MGPRGDGERGAVLPFFMVMLVGLLGFAGVAFDAGNLLAQRREAHNVAAAAARAGANDVTEESVRAGRPALAGSATATALAFVSAEGGRGAVATRPPDIVEVRVEIDVDYVFLGLFGAGSGTVSGTGTARVEGTRRD